jgi:hypothetical protein
MTNYSSSRFHTVRDWYRRPESDRDIRDSRGNSEASLEVGAEFGPTHRVRGDTPMTARTWAADAADRAERSVCRRHRTPVDRR